MSKNQSSYFSDLSNNQLSIQPIEPLLKYMEEIIDLPKIPSFLHKKGEYGEKVTELLTRLELRIARGNQSWEGLVVAFPGDRKDLTQRKMGTPYLRMILYPILDLHHRIREYEKRNMPCVYLVGDRFSDVLLRKFSLLRYLIPHVVVLTNDLYRCASRKSQVPDTKESSDKESWWQMKLCQRLDSEEGLKIPIRGDRFVKAGLLSYEVPASEASLKKERLDILGYDRDEGALVAFEIKGPGCGRVELENLFLQGLEHRNWLEQNKMAAKLIFDRGPLGKRVNTRKRVRLILGFCDEKAPDHFSDIREKAESQDPYLEIDFVRMSQERDGEIGLKSI